MPEGAGSETKRGFFVKTFLGGLCVRGYPSRVVGGYVHCAERRAKCSYGSSGEREVLQNRFV